MNPLATTENLHSLVTARAGMKRAQIARASNIPKQKQREAKKLDAQFA